MPIRDELRQEAIRYADAHLIDEPGIREGFKFIQDPALVDLIVLELRSARYIYRLMEMLDLKDSFSHPFCKFQIVQYAGVFEAAIDHLVFDRVYTSKKFNLEVIRIRDEIEKQESLSAVSGLSINTKITYDGSSALIAILKKSKRSRINIRFDDKLSACVQLDLVDARLSDEIAEIYKKRNSVHLSAKLKNALSVELSDTKRGFRRINGFCENVKRGLLKHREPI